MRHRISIRGSVRLSVRPSVCPSVHPSVGLSVHPSIRYTSSDITQMMHRVARLGLFYKFTGTHVFTLLFVISRDTRLLPSLACFRFMRSLYVVLCVHFAFVHKFLFFFLLIFLFLFLIFLFFFSTIFFVLSFFKLQTGDSISHF